MSKQSRLILLVSFVMSIVANDFPSRADMVIEGSTAETNHRFENDSSFLAGTAYAGMDFSGIGQASDSKWATLISPNVAITAHHFTPSGTISFYPGNDASASPVSRTVNETYRIPDTDIRLIALNANVTSDITYYPFATDFIDGSVLNPNIYAGETALMVGRSPVTISSSGNHRQAFGQNIIDGPSIGPSSKGYQENNDFNGADNDLLILIDNPVADSTSIGSPFNDPYDDTAVLFESQVRGGDSGAPFFTLNGTGDLLLLGINSAMLSYYDDANGNGKRDSGEQLYGEGSGASYVGNTSSTIQSFIDTHAVPEPSFAFLIIMSLSGTQLIRKRRQ